MRKRILLLACLLAATGMSSAMAHDESDEAHRTCGPVERGTDSSRLSYYGVCVEGVGTVRAGTDSKDNYWIAADGAKEQGASEGGPDTWGDGYLFITSADGGQGYCSGNGSYEKGRQADDEFGADCGTPPSP